MADAKIALTAEDQTKPAVESAKAGLRSFGTTAVAVSGQTQQALRMVPAQITDIVTSLQGGQAPLTVLLQQGGQLKDMFGGVGAAARAVGGYIAALITPLTVAGAAVAGLALAWHQGAQESQAYAKAVILSGNAAGTTSSQLQVMAQRVSAIVGTTGQAAEALALMVSSGQISNADLERYATMAGRLERVGVATKDTVASLAALGKDPVQASLRLNETMNFLEASTYRQIKALEERGKTEEAGELAQRTFSTAMEERGRRLEGQLSTLGKAWRAVTEEAGAAWNAMKGIGRAPEVDKQIAAKEEELRLRAQRFTGRDRDAGVERGDALLRSQIAALQQQKKATEDIAAADAKRAEQTKAAAGFEALLEGSLSRQEKTQRDIEKARNLGATAGATQEQINAVVGNISYEETKRGIDAQIARLKTAGELLDVRTKAAVAEIQAQRAMSVLNERQASDQSFELEMANMQARRALLEQEIALKAKERDSEKEVAALRGQVAVQDAQIAAARQDHANKIAEAVYKQKLAYDQLIHSEQELYQSEQDLERVAADKRFNQAQLAVAAYALSIQDANEQLDFEASLLGKSTEEQARLNEQRRIELSLVQQKRSIEDRARGGNLTGEQVSEMNRSAETAAASALSKVDTRIYLEKWKSVNALVSDSLYDVLTGRGKDAADRLKQIFGDMVLRPILQPVANYATNAIMGAVGGGGGAAGGGGSALGSLGSISNIASVGGSIGSAFMAGYGGATAAGSAFAAGGAASTAFGVGAGATGLAEMATIGGGTAAAAGTGGLMAGASAALAAIPVAGWIALAAIAAYSIFGGKGGGPKTESAYGPGVTQGGTNFSPTGAKTIVDLVAQQYGSTIKSLGGTPGELSTGARIAQDPAGDAKTMLWLEEQINGQNVYSREKRLGGVENVGRSQEELAAAINEDTTRATFAAIKATQGLSDAIKSILAPTDAYSSSLDEINATLQHAIAAQTQRKALEETIFQLTHTEAENLAHQRELELEGIDDVNKALARRIYGLQDEKKAQEEAASAIERAAQSAKAATKDAADFMLGVATDVRGYLDKLNGTPAGLLSPEDQLANSKQQLDRQLNLARTGDRAALQSLTSYADQYISAQTSYTASGAGTQDALNYVRRSLGGIDYSGLQGTVASHSAAGGGDGTMQLADVQTALQQILAVLASYASQDLQIGAQVASNTAGSVNDRLIESVS